MEVKKGYKNSAYGLIPNDWIECEFQDVLTGFSSGATPYRGIPEYYKGHIKWITSGELNYNVITDTIEKITEEAVRKTNLKLLPSGTFLMAITGLEAAGTRGSCAITGVEATTNQSCMALFPKENFDTGYLYHFYVWQGDNLAFKYCQGTKQQSYTGKIVRQIPIVLPSTKEEQIAIAAALFDADANIKELEKLKTKKNSIKQGAMQELFKPKAEWRIKKVNEFGEVVTGSTPSTQVKEYWNGVIPWITPTDINNKKNISSSERGITELGLKVSRKLPPNSVLVTCIASIGKNAILKKEGACNQQINAIIPNEEYDADFLYYLIEHNKKYILGKAGITATLLISKKEFSEITFIVPRYKKEQEEIAQILSDMDAEIEALETKLAKYRQLKQGMMQNLLSGKIRILEAVTE